MPLPIPRAVICSPNRHPGFFRPPSPPSPRFVNSLLACPLASLASQKVQPKKAEPPTIKNTANILNESGIQDDDDLLADFPNPDAIRPNARQSDASRADLSIHDDIEDKEEPSPEARKRTAQKNLDTIATLMAKQYGFSTDIATDIVKAIDGWEDRLAECQNTGNPTRLADIDESLRDFLMENYQTIQPLIDQALADKDA